MPLTIIALSAYAGLLIANFALAGIRYHINSIDPIWRLVKLLNKISVIFIPVAIVIDVIS